MQLIQTVTVGSGGAANIEFNSIPATFTDLVLVVSPRTGSTPGVVTQLNVQFNGTGGTAYSDRTLEGSGSSASSYARSSQAVIRVAIAPTASATSNTFGNASIYIPNYRSSTAKSVSLDGVGENNGTETYQNLVAGLFTGTSPITSIRLTLESATNFVEHSSASLYGILAGSSGGVIVS